MYRLTLRNFKDAIIWTGTYKTLQTLRRAADRQDCIYGSYLRREIVQLYTVKNVQTGELSRWSMAQILAEVNRDRTADWSDYTSADFAEGLEAFTEYRLKTSPLTKA
jgi:hypothetical protein